MAKAFPAAVLATLWMPALAVARPSAEEEIAALRAELDQLMQRLERLERSAAASAGGPGGGEAAEQDRAGTALPPGGARVGAPSRRDLPALVAAPSRRDLPAAPPRIELSGDFRYRHESIDEAGLPARGRHRIRARLGAQAAVTDDLTVELVLATGGDDPVSANQTLGEGFSRKDFGVDRAYFDWRPTAALRVAGGKMPNPFFRPANHHLIFDRDLNPEGLALRYGFGDWFFNLAGFAVEERGDAADSLLLGGQLGRRVSLAGGARLTAGLSYYDYRATQGRTPFFDGAAAGNRLDALGGYASDFDDLEAFAALELEARGRPLEVFGDYVVNRASAGDDAGFAVGASYGEVEKRGDWSLGWAYQELEADAVVGTFTDSDFGGGGTDNEGHVLSLSYGLFDRWRFDARYFANRRGADAGAERDYDRLQLDLVFDY